MARALQRGIVLLFHIYCSVNISHVLTVYIDNKLYIQFIIKHTRIMKKKRFDGLWFMSQQ